MAFYAILNGKPVRSDKTQNRIVNTRIYFTDGSWVDGRTGEVFNATGTGFITYDKPATESNAGTQKVTIGPKQETASRLELNDLRTDVTVGVHRGNHVEYTITGPKDQVDAISVDLRRGGTLVFENDPNSPQTGRGGVSISGLSTDGDLSVTGNTTISQSFGRGGMTIVMGGSATVEVKIDILVPRGMPLRANGVRGNVEIGDLEGPLTASVRSTGNVYTGRVTSAQLSAQGSAAVVVASVNGDVHAEARGESGIAVRAGSVPTLTADAQGSGTIAVDGSVTTAELSARGNGLIKVGGKITTATVNAQGSSTVRVKGNITTATVNAQGSGTVDVGGTITAAKLYARGSSRITASRVMRQLAKETRGSARINIRA